MQEDEGGRRLIRRQVEERWERGAGKETESRAGGGASNEERQELTEKKRGGGGREKGKRTDASIH